MFPDEGTKIYKNDKMNTELNNTPHRRYNILTGEWILVSPHRTKRPWQGKTEESKARKKRTYDPSCYLCLAIPVQVEKLIPIIKNLILCKRFFLLIPDTPEIDFQEGLLKAESEKGICKVVCFSPDHSLTFL